ncbi:ABC transporter ATP-binding protein [Desulfomarina sp.]
MAAIKLHHVTKVFPVRNWRSLLSGRVRQVRVLDEVSFSVEKGEIMGLLGPNGAGKTTLLKILATLIVPDGGTVSVLGLDGAGDGKRIREQVGFVNTNSRSFYWRLSGRDNMVFFGKLHNLSGRKLARRLDYLFDLVGMSEKASVRLGTYSSGERQRLAIARALLGDPQVLLMDEAASNLDPISSRDLLEFIKTELSRRQKKTILWCTHNLAEAEQLCDRVTILHHGRVIGCREPGNLTEAVTGRQRYYFSLDRLDDILVGLDGFVQEDEKGGRVACRCYMEDEEVPELIGRLVENKVRIYECRKLEYPLEESFSELVNSHEQSGGPDGTLA